MNRKPCFAIHSFSSRKRVLIVAKTRAYAHQRSEFLQRNGYEVDCASGSDAALTMSRTRSYDIILLALNCDSIDLKKLAGQIQKFNPNALVTCLADSSKAIPPLPGHRMLWKGEPLEYFLARVNALAATA